MNTIREQFDQAVQVYEAAVQALADTRQAHKEGAGKAYADMLAVQVDLKAKIAEHEASAAEAQSTFKRLFAKANHVVTKEVKAALFGKNDALAIAEELRSALAQSEAGALEPRIAASRAVEAYQRAHARAHAAYARMEIFRTLVQCGEAMARAVALATHIPGNPDIERLVDDVDRNRSAFVWDALIATARGLPEWARMPRVEALGALDLGPFNDPSQFISPSAAHLALKKKAMADGQAGTASELREAIG